MSARTRARGRCGGVLAIALLTIPAAHADIQTAAFVTGPWKSVQADAALATRVARGAIERDATHALRDIADVLDPEGDPGTLVALRQANAAYRNGYVAYSNEVYKEALSQFSTAALRLTEAAAASTVGPLVRAMQHAGAAAIRLRRYREGVRWFHRAAVLAPESPLVARGVDSGLVELYERVRRNATGQTPADLRVVSEPSGAAVYLDDRFVGVTPAAVRVPLAGTHIVRVEKDGHLLWGAPVEVLPGPVEDVEVRLKPTQQLARFSALLERSFPEVDSESLDARSAVRDLARLLNLDSVVLGRMEPREGGRIVLIACEYDVAGDQVVRRASRVFLQHSPQFVERVRTFFEELLGGQAGLDDAVARLPPPPPMDLVPSADDLAAPIPGSATRLPLARRWWFWPTVGIVAAGGLTAVTLAALPEQADQPSTGEILFQF